MSRGILALLCACSLMGCLLTRNPTYESPVNTPAVVLDDPDFPMNQFRRVFLTANAPADGGVATELEFRAIVRDPDIDQPLEGRVFMDYDPNASQNGTITNDLVFAPTMRDTREVSFVVDYSELDLGCRVIELHVSEGFVNTRNPTPRTPGDLGRGIWVIHVFAHEDDDRPLRGCIDTTGSNP